MRRPLRVVAVLALAPLIAAFAAAHPRPIHPLRNLFVLSDLDEARALFEKNLAAIQKRDKAAYLACYLDSERLARTSPDGPVLGFRGLREAGGRRSGPTRSSRTTSGSCRSRRGVVYGTYRYRVRYGADEHSGLSERLFVKTPKGWRITVTSAFDAPAGTPPPPRAFVGRDARRRHGSAARRERRRRRARRAGSTARGPRAPARVPEGVVVDGREGHVDHARTRRRARPLLADRLGRRPARRVRRPRDASVRGAEKELRDAPRALLPVVRLLRRDVGLRRRRLPVDAGPPRARRERPLAPRVAAAGPAAVDGRPLAEPARREAVHLPEGRGDARDGVRYLASRGAQAVKVWYIVRPDLPVEATAPRSSRRATRRRSAACRSSSTRPASPRRRSR